MVRLIVDYGYDIHGIDLDDDAHAKIKAGKKVQIEGQGFFHEEDGGVQDFWSFNTGAGEVSFTLDNGAEFHATDWWIEE